MARGPHLYTSRHRSLSAVGLLGGTAQFLVGIGRLLDRRAGGRRPRLAVEPLPRLREVALHVLHVQPQLHGEPVGILPGQRA